MKCSCSSVYLWQGPRVFLGLLEVVCSRCRLGVVAVGIESLEIGGDSEAVEVEDDDDGLDGGVRLSTFVASFSIDAIFILDAMMDVRFCYSSFGNMCKQNKNQGQRMVVKEWMLTFHCAKPTSIKYPLGDPTEWSPIWKGARNLIYRLFYPVHLETSRDG